MTRHNRSHVFVVASLKASDSMRMGIRDAASDAAYELLALRRGIGPADELEPADEALASSLAEAAARAGLQAATAAMLPLIEAA